LSSSIVSPPGSDSSADVVGLAAGRDEAPGAGEHPVDAAEVEQQAADRGVENWNRPVYSLLKWLFAIETGPNAKAVTARPAG
jgi:hypothetical protein